MRYPIFVHAESVPQLTKRENQVATLIIEGRGGPEIAGIMGISSKSVKQHVRGALKKLRVASRAEIAEVVRYYRNAWGEG